MARVSRHRNLPMACWPATDRAAFGQALRKGDLLEPGGVAAHWSTPMIIWASETYGQWLGWLRLHDMLDPNERPDRRVRPERVAAWIQDMTEDLAAATVAGRIRGLLRMIDVMVQCHDCGFLRATLRRMPYEPAAGPRTVGSHDLLDLGLLLMAEAEELEAPAKVRARRFRDGLMIALASLAPLRRRNFAGLWLGRSLVRVNGTWRVRFAASGTKTRRAIDRPFPQMLVPLLERYLDRHRAALAPAGVSVDAACGPLWVSGKDGSAMSGHTISLTVATITAERLGENVSLQGFRKAAPTTLAVHAPERIRLAPAALGHADSRTTQQWYNMADGVAAAGRLQDTISDIRKEIAT